MKKNIHRYNDDCCCPECTKRRNDLLLETVEKNTKKEEVVKKIRKKENNMDKIKCSKTVYPNDRWGSYYGHPCRFDFVVERDGKPYCKIHDPEREEAKRKERQEKWDKENKKERETHRRLQAMYQACEGVSTKVLMTIKVKDLIAMMNPIPGCEGDETK